jgi:hypothetical protein
MIRGASHTRDVVEQFRRINGVGEGTSASSRGPQGLLNLGSIALRTIEFPNALRSTKNSKNDSKIHFQVLAIQLSL